MPAGPRRVVRATLTALVFCQILVSSAAAQTSPGAIIAPDEGERLTRLWGFPLTIKIDPVTVGSKDFVAGTEDLRPHQAIPWHRHHHMEEIVVVQSGDIVARIGNQKRQVGAGAIAFGPPNTWMCFENVGENDARVLWIFSRPGFEVYVRATSVPFGQVPVPPSSEEMDQIRKKYLDEIELGAGSGMDYPKGCVREAVPSP